MKHLPNELLYLLKVYNYIRDEVGLDRARSRADDIRAYIAGADYLQGFPGIMEYLSEKKSMEDIITYIQRNERTYSLLGEWKDREIASIFAEKGIEGSFGIVGGFSVRKRDDGCAYFTLPFDLCTAQNIVLLDAAITDDIYVEKVLWLELYRSREGMCLEFFDDNCRTFKISFSDLYRELVFLSATPLCNGAKTIFDGTVRMAEHIYKKHSYDPSLLNVKERELFPLLRFLSEVGAGTLRGTSPETDLLLAEFGIEKGRRLLCDITACEDEKKAVLLSKKMSKLLKSKKCGTLIERLCNDIKESQLTVPQNIQ